MSEFRGMFKERAERAGVSRKVFVKRFLGEIGAVWASWYLWGWPGIVLAVSFYYVFGAIIVEIAGLVLKGAAKSRGES